MSTPAWLLGYRVGDEVLTLGEVAVLQALADGARQPAIAQHLHLSCWTIRDRVRSARRKLGGARNGTEAVALAWRAGVIT